MYLVSVLAQGRELTSRVWLAKSLDGVRNDLESSLASAEMQPRPIVRPRVTNGYGQSQTLIRHELMTSRLRSCENCAWKVVETHVSWTD